MKRLVFTLILTICAQWLFSQSRMSSADVSFLYNQDHEFLIDHRLAQDGNKVKVYVRFILNSGVVKISDYEIQYDIRDSYIDEKHVNSATRLDSAALIATGFREFIYSFEFEKTPDQSLIVLEVNNILRNRKFLIDIPIQRNKNTRNQPFLIFEAQRNVPYFSRFVNLDQAVRLVNVFGNDGKYQVQGVVNNQAVAIPTFDEGRVQAPTVIEIDTLYGPVEGEIMKFSTAGYYVINDSTEPSNSMGILVTDSFYPYFGQFEKMIEPLIFISTNDEFKTLRRATDSRMAFEDFVTTRISNGGKVAQDFVKFYYRRVRKSAHLFTSNKEGWKTDRGMVYQIYGNPLQVFRNEEQELWVYAAPNGGRIRFNFAVVSAESNLLEYSLIRESKYKESWMDAVTSWRSGKVIE
ncbi:GWxTD domain-containing protein [uncultured Roseivirga sp.]|uniref:GWxTD domain-containing protein n=1 Tax=uncultured Roseivirga sp. TaxID=543088 RepID=UPI0030D8DB1D|tara:strand:+ start:171027 stop:172247 length:1221 start_codon:yes stop_codon:yes gene_type:complete